MQDYWTNLFKEDSNMVAYIRKTDIESVLYKLLETINGLKEKDKLSICMIVEYYMSMIVHSQIENAVYNKLATITHDITQLKGTFEEHATFSSYQKQIKEVYSSAIIGLIGMNERQNIKRLCLMVYRLYCDDLFPSYNCDDLLDVDTMIVCSSIVDSE